MKKRNQKAAEKEAKDNKRKAANGKAFDAAPLKVIETSQKGGTCVDHKVPDAKNFEVVKDYQGKPCSTYMVCTDVKNNSNKFYIVQLLKTGQRYRLWTRWGRVGVDGQIGMEEISDQDTAIRSYHKKKNSKLSKYKECAVNFGNESSPTVQAKIKKIEKEEEKKAPAVKSKLPQSVQDLVNFIYDDKLIESSVVRIGYDPKKLPLGQLSMETINEGLKVLKQIEKVIRKKEKGSLDVLSDQFYMIIPHDFGFKHMSQFIINTLEKVQEKLDLCNNLAGIKIAHNLVIPKTKGKQEKVNPIDQNYLKLNCQIQPVDQKDKTFDILKSYLDNTRLVGSNAKLLELWDLQRPADDKKFPAKMPNHMLLWHGSRFSNFVGILSEGLRVAPPSAPSSGYLYGKGIYFADCFGKSANYCRTDLSGGVGLMLLCEVALGEQE